jgi:dTDP-glucose pyrophosphorylase
MGPNGEIIMDYSIYDAKEAGFDKVVFIIRKDIEEEFKEVIGNRIQNYMDVEYVFQSFERLMKVSFCSSIYFDNLSN